MVLVPYNSPVDPVLYPFLAFLFCVVGLTFFASFIVSQLQAKSSTRNIVNESIHALVASGILGLGIFFVMLAGGIYL
ncbi:hypothetical protein SAMD00019534_084790, partial [Acytostelium subglobosum LB1]|uniref:hypothetical protein n=1 Tax=Acytostelium subglobosum LB1 TaxID=1410327 RepID=UPI000644B0F4